MSRLTGAHEFRGTLSTERAEDRRVEAEMRALGFPEADVRDETRRRERAREE